MANISVNGKFKSSKNINERTRETINGNMDKMKIKEKNILDQQQEGLRERLKIVISMVKL